MGFWKFLYKGDSVLKKHSILSDSKEALAQLQQAEQKFIYSEISKDECDEQISQAFAKAARACNIADDLNDSKLIEKVEKIGLKCYV